LASADATPPDARIISRALSPSQPVFPNTIPITLFAALAGLLFSAGAIAMHAMTFPRAPLRAAPPPPREMVDLAPAEPVAHEAPPAAPLPEPQALPKEPQAWPLPARTESSRRLIERIAEASGRGGAHVLIASAGDSTPACASLTLARSLALEGRAILLQTDDDDLFLSEALEVAAGGACDASHPGLTQLLSGEASFADAIFRDDASRLHIVQAGGPVDAHSSDLSLILDALHATYDFVLVAAGADAAAQTLAAESDLTLIFVKDRETRAVLHGDFQASGARPIILAGFDQGGEIVEIAA
jgi:Mrp family chromosome partitioning ATPase